MALKVKDARRSNEQKQAAIEEATKEELVNLNLRIPESLHKSLRLQAISEGHNVTLKSIVVRAVEAYLQSNSHDDHIH